MTKDEKNALLLLGAILAGTAVFKALQPEKYPCPTCRLPVEPWTSPCPRCHSILDWRKWQAAKDAQEAAAR